MSVLYSFEIDNNGICLFFADTLSQCQENAINLYDYCRLLHRSVWAGDIL